MSSVFFQEAMLTFNNFENKKNMVDIFWLIPVFLRLSIFLIRPFLVQKKNKLNG